jgi:hypothetical protein
MQNQLFEEALGIAKRWCGRASISTQLAGQGEDGKDVNVRSGRSRHIEMPTTRRAYVARSEEPQQRVDISDPGSIWARDIVPPSSCR